MHLVFFIGIGIAFLIVGSIFRHFNCRRSAVLMLLLSGTVFGWTFCASMVLQKKTKITVHETQLLKAQSKVVVQMIMVNGKPEEVNRFFVCDRIRRIETTTESAFGISFDHSTVTYEPVLDEAEQPEGNPCDPVEGKVCERGSNEH